jgi:hypothetical protein
VGETNYAITHNEPVYADYTVNSYLAHFYMAVLVHYITRYGYFCCWPIYEPSSNPSSSYGRLVPRSLANYPYLTNYWAKSNRLKREPHQNPSQERLERRPIVVWNRYSTPITPISLTFQVFKHSSSIPITLTEKNKYVGSNFLHKNAKVALQILQRASNVEESPFPIH